MKNETEKQALIRVCAITIYKGSHGHHGCANLSTQTRAKFWSQVFDIPVAELTRFIEQARILDGHAKGAVDNGMKVFWYDLRNCNADSCKRVFNKLRDKSPAIK